jgi:hypothetical protein
LQIPLKERIGAKREEIGGEIEVNFMDNSITTKLEKHKKNQGMGTVASRLSTQLEPGRSVRT